MISFKSHYITEWLRKQPKIMYHGTTDKVLHDIMTKGILSNPPSRVYSGQPPDYELNDPDINKETYRKSRRIRSLDVKTLGGSYWTPEIYTAITGAQEAVSRKGGNAAIIIAEIVPQSGYMDEDSIMFDMVSNIMSDVIRLGKGSLGDLYNKLFYIKKDYRAVKNIIDSLDKTNIDSPGYLYRTAIMAEIPKYFDIKKVDPEIRRLIEEDIIYLVKYHYFVNHSEEFDKYISEEEYKSMARKKEQILHRLTRTLRNLKTNTAFDNVRMADDIGFSGRNKIMGAVVLKYIPPTDDDEEEGKMSNDPYIKHKGSYGHYEVIKKYNLRDRTRVDVMINKILRRINGQE